MRALGSFSFVALLGVLSALSLLLCVAVITIHVDKAQLRREAGLLSTRVDADLAAGEASMQVWSRSDEAVRRLDHARDAAWAASTFPDLPAANVWTFTFDHADLLVSGHGDARNGATADAIRSRVTERIRRLRALAALDDPIRRRVVTDFFWSQGALYLLTVAPIVPASAAVRLRHARPPLLAAVSPYELFVRSNLDGMGLDGLAVVGPDRAGKAVRDARGQIVARIVWRPTGPGAELRHVVLWPALALSGAFILLLAVGERRAQRERSRLVASEARASHLAFHDQLTGLANRRSLMASLEQAVGRAETSGEPLALLLIDLDRFKAVNDTHGHQCGDELIVATAHRLVEACEATRAIPARLGGDEFVLLLPGGDPTAAQWLAQRVIGGLFRPVELSQAVVAPEASVGVAVHQPGQDAANLLRAADQALYRAKGEGRSGRNGRDGRRRPVDAAGAFAFDRPGGACAAR